MKLPPITIQWEEVERNRNEFWDDKPVSIVDLARLDDGSKQYFKERLVYDPELNVLHVRYKYDYEVDLDRLNNQMDLLHWTDHLLGKTWMTREGIRRFIRKVCEIKKWNLFYSL